MSTQLHVSLVCKMRGRKSLASRRLKHWPTANRVSASLATLGPRSKFGVCGEEGGGGL